MGYDFQMVYTLRQHTPIIHFQYDQAGATLRATEVKPKLDRFILNSMSAEDEFEAKKNGWFIGETKALNYKMRFYAQPKEPRVELKNNYDIYYGNMGNNYIEGIEAQNDQVTMKIICFNKDLRKKIEDLLENFFNVTNFGRMQNKGFGSFTLESNNAVSENDQSDKIKQQLCEYYGATHCYYFQKGKAPFKRIKAIYSIIKSGLNFRGYRRSLLFYYMHDMSIGNEKAWLKQNDMAPTDVGPHANSENYKKYRPNANNHSFRYVRALLGVGDHMDFKNSFGRKDTVRISCAEKDNKGKALIERFPSPIFFKVIGNCVYYVGGRIGGHSHNESNDPEIWGRKFLFENKKRGELLETPAKNEKSCFNENFMDGFLEYCYKELNDSSPRGGREAALSQFINKEKVTIDKYERKGGRN